MPTSSDNSRLTKGMEGTDAAEVARARDGDTDAFRALVDRHSRSVFRVAYRMTGNEHDAEEVVQDAFLRAYRQLHRFESRANFGTWIYRIAVNCSVDLLRTRMRHDDRRAPDLADGVDPLTAIASDDPEPDRLLLSVEVQDHLRRAFGGLSQLERAAFTLRHFEGRSIDEIGKALGLKTNATKHSIFRAVRKLRVALEPFVSEAVKEPLRTKA
jgi:RNA polymerase sigma-70 factor, ECF subfamily